ncbi:PREDICTED: glutamate receptor ionotropic, kainate 3-like isoform X2 [Acropora digitifera]|uniref:glutamate receptor ionotropic, kainate 3-like isoform X2 n=1 Tax=Acropora digitifera TaxID=70779 RepID=UPI00077A8946|nr:PREDICTED: glutamate receptor ionotropic, kainate 3-like isoform X2 [Acropora digitifera]
MEKAQSIFNIMILLLLVTKRANTLNKVVTCGFIGSHSELDSLTFAFNNAFFLKNVSVLVAHVNNTAVIHQKNFFALIEGRHAKAYACALSTVTGIPLVSLYGSKRPFDQCDKAVHMSAGYRDYAHATLDIVNEFQWQRVASIYDENRVHEAGYFHALSRRSKLTVNLVQLSELGQSADGMKPVLQAMNEIKRFQPDVILLYTKDKNIGLFVQQKALQLLSGFKWIIQGQVPINLNCDPRNVVLAMEITHFQTFAPGKKKIADRVKINSGNTELDIALAYDAAQVIAHVLKQCVLVNDPSIDSKDGDVVITCLREASLDGLTGPLHFSEDGARTNIEMDILNLRNNSFKKIGLWNSTKRSVLFDNISPNVNSPLNGSLEGRKFRVAVIEEAPFVMVVKQNDGSLSYEGYCIDLLNKLAENLHFTYEIHISQDEAHGAESENGSWNGLIGELVNERADLAVADLTITERREKVVDFTIPYMFTTEDVILKKSSSGETVDYLQFTNPLHSEVWFAMLATLLVVSVAVFILNYFSPFGYKDDNELGTSQEFSFFNSMWFSLACMLQQGAENQPRNLSGRILTGCYWFCIVIWISTYTANLAAFLTVKNAHQTITNLEDLAESSYRLLILNSSSTYEALKQSDLETHKRIWRRIKKDDIVSTTSLAIQKVREKEDFAFINEGTIVQYAASQEPCDLTIIAGLTTAKGLALALQTNDPHTYAFTLGILRLHENFFLAKLKRKWWKTTSACHKEPNTKLSNKRIDLKSLVGVFMVLGAGLLLAFLTLIAEVLYKRKRKQKGKASICNGTSRC